jgi:hypothetical protein
MYSQRSFVKSRKFGEEMNVGGISRSSAGYLLHGMTFAAFGRVGEVLGSLVEPLQCDLFPAGNMALQFAQE